MSLTLHFRPLSSFCWQALIALYENDTPFTPNMANLGDEAETRFISGEADLAWQTRLSGQFYDLYVHLSVQKMVDDRLRPIVPHRLRLSDAGAIIPQIIPLGLSVRQNPHRLVDGRRCMARRRLGSNGEW